MINLKSYRSILFCCYNYESIIMRLGLAVLKVGSENEPLFQTKCIIRQPAINTATFHRPIHPQLFEFEVVSEWSLLLTEF